MEEQDQLNEFFRQKLSNYQEAVRPEIWTAVSSAISKPILVATGISLLSKMLIGVGIAASLLVVGYLFNSLGDKNTNRPIQENKVQEESLPLNIPNNETISNSGVYHKKISREIKNNPITIVDVAPENMLTLNGKKIVASHEVSLSEEGMPNDWEDKLPTKETIQLSSDVPEIIVNTDSPEVKEDNLPLVLSNVFTPNGDGKNDFLSITSQGLSDFSVVVLNTSNQIVFKSSDPNFNWDGKSANGDEVPAGNYIYFFTAKLPTGKTLQQSSSLFIQR